jgi:hypothetical protein
MEEKEEKSMSSSFFIPIIRLYSLEFILFLAEFNFDYYSKIY